MSINLHPIGAAAPPRAQEEVAQHTTTPAWRDRKDAEIQREFDRIIRRDLDAQMRYYPAMVPTERRL